VDEQLAIDLERQLYCVWALFNVVDKTTDGVGKKAVKGLMEMAQTLVRMRLKVVNALHLLYI
jgi:hypothetical protein